MPLIKFPKIQKSPGLPLDVTQITFGNGGNGAGSIGKGLGNDSPSVFSTQIAATPGISTFSTGGGFYSTLPAIVPFGPTASSDGNTSVVPSSTSNTGGGPNPVTSALSPSSLVSDVGNIVANPTQHILGLIVLALVAWWLYKHVLKKI